MPDAIVRPTPHLDKLDAALANPKCQEPDRALLREAKGHYSTWITATNALATSGRPRVDEMVRLLNVYKDVLEVELIAKRGSDFLKRQKGQLKLDNSILEEFLPHLLRTEIIERIEGTSFVTGPQQAFMSLAFMPSGFRSLGGMPQVVVKSKDQDFAIATPIHYQFSPSGDFPDDKTASGQFALAVFASETKVNLDKTMFQEAAGTAQRLKQGCPVARYFLLVEYLDMTPEDPRLTEIDNVYLLRKAKRLPFEQRSVAANVERQHREFPIAADVVWAFTQQIQTFVDSAWYDADEALRRGSFL